MHLPIHKKVIPGNDRQAVVSKSQIKSQLTNSQSLG